MNVPNRNAWLGGVWFAIPILLLGVGVGLFWEWLNPKAIAAACEPNGYFCRLVDAANLPTLLLVFVGIGAIWAALKTLDTIKRQADLQQSAMLQWIDFTDWSNGFSGDGRNLIIRFTISNPTNFPITIKRSLIVFGENRLKYSAGDGQLLTPQNPIHVRIEISITEEERRSLATRPLIFGVKGELRYTDMGPNRETIMSIVRNLSCGLSACKFDPEVSKTIPASEHDA